MTEPRLRFLTMLGLSSSGALRPAGPWMSASPACSTSDVDLLALLLEHLGPTTRRATTPSTSPSRSRPPRSRPPGSRPRGIRAHRLDLLLRGRTSKPRTTAPMFLAVWIAARPRDAAAEHEHLRRRHLARRGHLAREEAGRTRAQPGAPRGSPRCSPATRARQTPGRARACAGCSPREDRRLLLGSCFTKARGSRPGRAPRRACGRRALRLVGRRRAQLEHDVLRPRARRVRHDAAPAASYIASENLARSPAPLCTVTLKPALTSVLTESGVCATRFSIGFVSFGTPTLSCPESERCARADRERERESA